MKNITRMKGNQRETYDEATRKLLGLIPTGDEEGEYTDEFRMGLLNARIDLKRGKVVNLAETKKPLGL